jgi:hypothetical protein
MVLRQAAVCLGLALLISCAHSDSYKIESAVNVYLDRLREYDSLCHQKPDPRCKEFYESLLQARTELGYSSQALLRGGDMTPQMTKLNLAMRRLDAARIHP